MLKQIANSLSNYQELISYLSYNITEDISLQTPSDTIPATFAHFERNFDVAPFANVDIGFQIEHLNSDLEDHDSWQIVFDASRFGLGPLQFRFESQEVIE